mgnify:CR=1 FL=1
MPQKKNPDVAELARGKSGRLIGDLTAVLTVIKGLPFAYNRDLQEDKEPVFDASDTLQLSIQVFTAMLPSIQLRRARIEAAVAEGFMEATDLADYLVTKGVPFRVAHEVIGRIVRYCVENEHRLPDLGVEDFRRFHEAFGADVKKVLTPEAIVARRNNPGGTAPVRVKKALREARKRL